MARYIDTDELCRQINDLNPFENADMDVKISEIMGIITDMLSADVQEVKHAKWTFMDGHLTCTLCKSQPYKDHSRIDFSNLYKYCPYCGAKMY